MYTLVRASSFLFFEIENSYFPIVLPLGKSFEDVTGFVPVPVQTGM